MRLLQRVVMSGVVSLAVCPPAYAVVPPEVGEQATGFTLTTLGWTVYGLMVLGLIIAGIAIIIPLVRQARETPKKGRH